ncbi:MAG: hypothetical protein R6U98_29630 [Pirellulaceae bacterium]
MAMSDRSGIDPQLHERRERIATAVLAELVGRAGEYQPEHAQAALRAADELMKAIDREGL